MKPSYIYLLSNLETDLRLPGFNVDAGQSSALDYARYLGDESLRSAINSLVSRNAMQVLSLLEADRDTQFNAGAYFLAEWFPILTEAELEFELERRPLVPELGRALILAVEPSDDSLAAGQGALYITNDPLNGFGVWVKAKGTYAQLSPDDGDQGLIYTAKQIGSSGNLLSVQHVLADPGVAEDVVVTVIEVEDAEGNKHTIHVVLPTSADAVAAELFLRENGVNSDIILTAKEAGAAGNLIVLVKDDLSDDEVDDTTVDVVSGDDDTTIIEVVLSQTAAVLAAQATITSESAAPNSQIVFTALEAVPGPVGNLGRVKIVADDDAEAVTVTATNSGFFDGEFMFVITVPSIDGVPNANVNNVVEAVTAFNSSGDPYAADIGAAAESGDGGLVDVWDSGPYANNSYALTGGANYVAPTVTATAADVKAAIEADDDANALVAVTNGVDGDGSAVVLANTTNELDGGQDAGVVIAAPSDVASTVNGLDASSALISADTVEGTLAALDLTPLTGGSDTEINASKLAFD